MDQYNQRNNTEITGIRDNIGDLNCEHSVIEVFKATDIQISHNNIEDSRDIGKSKDHRKIDELKIL